MAAEKPRSVQPEPVAAKLSGDGLLNSAALEQSLADLSKHQKQLVKDWAQEWERTVKLRMEQDTQLVAQLILDLGIGVEQGPAVAPPVSRAVSNNEEGASEAMTMRASSASTTGTTVVRRTRTALFDDSNNDFVLLPLWIDDPDQVAMQRMTRLTQHRSSTPRAGLPSKEDVDTTVATQETSWLSPIMLYPSSPQKMLWDVFGALMIFYDLFSISLSVFDPPATDFAEVLTWVSLIFWTLNMGMSLIVGYTEDGVTVMSPMRICRRYLRTWFIIDIVVVGLDWVFTVYALVEGSAGGAGSSVRLLRVLRLFRMVRLARLLKLRSILQNFYDLIDSEYLGIFADIGMMLVLLFLICHVIACLWFWVGSAEDDRTWIKNYQFDVVDWPYQYATSFHWAITQFTPASMSVQPQNLLERVFAIIIVLFALVGFSYVVGSITGSLTQLRMMRENVSTQFWELRRYLRKHNVPHGLAVRIQKYLEHVMETERKSMPAKNVKILGLLSEQLKSELEFEICNSQLSVHPLFEHMTDISRVSMHRLANTAVSHQLLARTDHVFVDNEEATHMYFVVRGHLNYLRQDSRGIEHSELVNNHEDWIAEPVLWMKRWMHLGELTAIIECDLMLLGPRKFQDVVRLNPLAFTLARTYARNFGFWINGEDRDSLSDISQGECVGDRVRELMEVTTPRGGTGSLGLRHLKSAMRPSSGSGSDLGLRQRL